MKLSDYSNKTCLPEKYLRDNLGLSEYTDRDGSTVLEIPYFTKDSKLFRKRLRKKDNERWWSPGEGLIPYGLNLFSETSDYVVLCEGESDCQTLVYSGYNALGVPGAATFKTEWTQYVNTKQTVYLAGDNDEAGKKFNQDVAEKLLEGGYGGEIKTITMPEGVKDVNQLYNSKSGVRFLDLMKGAEKVASGGWSEELDHHNNIPPRGEYSMMVEALPVIDLSQMPEPQAMTFIIEDMVPEGYLSVLFGDGGRGKSFLTLHMASCIATGKNFLDKNVVKCNVLYVDFELDELEQTRRAYKVARGLGLERPPKGLYYLAPGS